MTQGDGEFGIICEGDSSQVSYKRITAFQRKYLACKQKGEVEGDLGAGNGAWVRGEMRINKTNLFENSRKLKKKDKMRFRSLLSQSWCQLEPGSGPNSRPRCWDPESDDDVKVPPVQPEHLGHTGSYDNM